MVQEVKVLPVPRPFPLFLAWETLLLSLVALFLCQSPLTGAFAYEFSFFLGVGAVLIAAGGSSFRLARIARGRPINCTDRARVLPSNLISLIGPLLVVHLYSHWIPTCRWEIGWAWFGLLPVISSIFGSASALWVERLHVTSLKSFGLALLPMFLFSLWTLTDLYIGPSLSFLNPAFGFFAGPIYDEWVPIQAPVITYRIWTLLLSTWLIFVSFRIQRRPLWIIVTVLVFFPLLMREPLGWHRGNGKLQRELPHVLKTDRLHLRYAPTSFSKDEALNLVDRLDRRVERMNQELGLSQHRKNRPITIYLYPDATTKHRLTGTRYTAIGNPITRSVHALAKDPPGLLTHEIAHVASAPLGLPGLGLSLRIGLLEGLATSTEKYRGDLSLHEWARAMQQLNLLPSMKNLLKPTGFWGESPSRAYLASGSFCRWLIDTRGIRSFQNIYRGRSFQSTYGRSVETLVAKWEAFLRRSQLSPTSLSIAEIRLRQKPIFKRRCPHDVADAVQAGYGCWVKKDIPGAIHHFEKAWNDSGHSPSHTLRLARSKARNQNWSEVRTLAVKVLRSKESSLANIASAKMLIGDSAVVAGGLGQAIANYAAPERNQLPEKLRLALDARSDLATAFRKRTLKELIATGPTLSWCAHFLAQKKSSKLKRAYLFAATKVLEEGDSGMAGHFLTLSLPDNPAQTTILQLKIAARIAEKRGSTQKSLTILELIETRAETEGVRLFAQEETLRLRH